MMNLNDTAVPLSKISEGASCRIAGLQLDGLLRRRIQDLGILPGTTVQCIRRGPSGDPTAYEVRGTTIALRKEDACQITVFPI